MTFIPKAICGTCSVPYKVKKNGANLACYAGEMYYYSIYADLYVCPSCGHSLLIGFGEKPYHHHFDGPLEGTPDFIVQLGP